MPKRNQIYFLRASLERESCRRALWHLVGLGAAAEMLGQESLGPAVEIDAVDGACQDAPLI